MQFNLLCCRDIHINAKGHASQNVSISTQLFSKTVSSAFEVFGMPVHAWFVLTVNNFFDVMNSTAVEHTNKLKCAYGVHESQQREALVNMEKLLLSMKFGSPEGRARRERMPFQKGLLVGIKGFLYLFDQLKKDGFQYLMTVKVNIS